MIQLYKEPKVSVLLVNVQLAQKDVRGTCGNGPFIEEKKRIIIIKTLAMDLC